MKNDFNQWKELFSCPNVYKLNPHYYRCSWNYHINIVDRHINLFSDCMCFFFFFFFFHVSTVQHPNLRTNVSNNTTQWIPLVKLDATGQILRSDVFGLCLEIEAYPITKSILKRHFMPKTFISIDNNRQRRIRLLIIDRLSHDTVFSNLYFICQM